MNNADILRFVDNWHLVVGAVLIIVLLVFCTGALHIRDKWRQKSRG